MSPNCREYTCLLGKQEINKLLLLVKSLRVITTDDDSVVFHPLENIPLALFLKNEEELMKQFIVAF